MESLFYLKQMPKKYLLPNFFILGAAKCGTTSLYHYLRQHPEIYMSPIKEPCFFCDSFQVVRDPVAYSRLFENAGNLCAIGEASHVYLTNPSSAKTLKTFLPDAKFILTLRHPADRAYSLYHHMRRYGYETIGTFEKALAAEEKRFRSKRFKKNCNQYFYNFLYFRSGLFACQIKRFFDLFDQSRFHILTLDRLKKDPARELSAIYDFLGVKNLFQPEIKVHNPGLTSRLPRLENFLNLRLRKPKWLRRRALQMAEKYNMKPVPPVGQETRAGLARRYTEDLAMLYSLTGIRFELS
jgi:hypothetical protein